MTIEEMRERISNQEYHQWRAFFSWRDAMQKLEMEKAKHRGR